MSYLTLAAGIPNFSKAVISVWFRVPMESAVAASTHSMEGIPLPDFPMMQQNLPLIMFGKPQQNKHYVLEFTNVLVGHPDPSLTFYAFSGYHAETAYDVEPSYIAAICGGGGSFRLQFNIQMGGYASYHFMNWLVTELRFEDGVYHPTIEDGAFMQQDAQPEFFHVDSDISLEPDEWHHLLLSFDVSGELSIGAPFAHSACKLWYAIDDADYRGAIHLQPYRDEGDDLDANAILTQNMYDLSGGSGDPVIILGQTLPAPTGTYNPGPIPTVNEHFSIPGSTKHKDAIFRVEMAEFQMWTGVTLDTGVLANRRAFIDFKRDEEGNPVDDVLRPVNPTKGTQDDPRGPGERLLGKKPEILLHGSSNWKIGYNTGTIGVEIGTDGELTKIPAGQFEPTAKIEPWKPDPSLDEETA